MIPTDEALSAIEPIVGGWHVKTRDDGRYCIDVLMMLFNYRLVLSEIDHTKGIVHGWCYFGHGIDANGMPRTMAAAYLNAMVAALAWDGYGEPAGYDKQAV